MLNCKAFKTYIMLQNIMKTTKSQNSSKKKLNFVQFYFKKIIARL